MAAPRHASPIRIQSPWLVGPAGGAPEEARKQTALWRRRSLIRAALPFDATDRQTPCVRPKAVDRNANRSARHRFGDRLAVQEIGRNDPLDQIGIDRVIGDVKAHQDLLQLPKIVYYYGNLLEIATFAEILMMPRRPKHQRPSKDIKPGRLSLATIESWDLDVIAQKVRYVPSGEHKNYPSETGLWTIGHKIDKAKCDRFVSDQWGQIEVTLRDAIRAGCVDAEFRGGFPSRVWAYINGRLHEARLSNQTRGEYHGFPLDYPEQFPMDPDNLLRMAPRVPIPVH